MVEFTWYDSFWVCRYKSVQVIEGTGANNSDGEQENSWASTREWCINGENQGQEYGKETIIESNQRSDYNGSRDASGQ